MNLPNVFLSSSGEKKNVCCNFFEFMVMSSNVLFRLMKGQTSEDIWLTVTHEEGEGAPTDCFLLKKKLVACIQHTDVHRVV